MIANVYPAPAEHPLRNILAESHIAAVAIAVLVFSSLDAGFRAFWGPLSAAATFLFTAIAIFDIPYFSFNVANCLALTVSLYYFFSAMVCLGVACLLSRWVYGVGPFFILNTYWAKLAHRETVEEQTY
ncbi:MAG: hypothetical protein ACRD2U_13865 [Terriglobales bacterium]